MIKRLNVFILILSCQVFFSWPRLTRTVWGCSFTLGAQANSLALHSTFLLRIHTRIWVWCRCSLCTHFCPEAIHSFVYPYISFLLLLPFKMGPSMTKCSKCVLHSYVLGMHENNTISYQCSDTMCEHCMALMGIISSLWRSKHTSPDADLHICVE